MSNQSLSSMFHMLTYYFSGSTPLPSSVTVLTRPPPRRSSSWVPSRRTSSAPLKCFLLSYEKSCLRHDRRFVIQLAVWQLGKTNSQFQNDSHPKILSLFSQLLVSLCILYHLQSHRDHLLIQSCPDEHIPLAIKMFDSIMFARVLDCIHLQVKLYISGLAA